MNTLSKSVQRRLASQTSRRVAEPSLISGVLSDRSIRDLAKVGLIEPFDKAFLQPNSYDVHIGDLIKVESEPSNDWKHHQPYFREVPLSDHSGGYLIPPLHSFLGSLKERITIPNNVCAQFFLCSSDGRKLRDHALAGWIDSGYFGNITTEFRNNSHYTHWHLKEGDRIGQLVFYWTDQPVESPYNGRYQGDEKVTLAR